MNLYEFYASDKKVNITENLIHAKDVEIDVITENLRKWFKEKWVRFGPDGKIRGDCARGSESEGKPKCLPRSKAQSLGKKGRASAASKKRREDPNPERRGSAINVSTKVKEEHELTLKNVFENKGRATGVDTTAKAQRDRLSTASVGAGPGPGARSQTPPAGVQRQSPVQLVDPASAARYANRLSTTKIITSPGVSKATPTVSSTMNQQAKLGIIDQGLSRLAGNLVKRDGKWFHPGGVPVTNPELIKKAEMSISRPPGTTASGTVKPAPTTGVSTDLPSKLSGGGSDNDYSRAPASLPPVGREPSSVTKPTDDQLAAAADLATGGYSGGKKTEPTASSATTTTTTTSTPSSSSYTIQRGDTLSQIAKRFGTTTQELMRLNPDIKDPNKIFAGKTLRTPGVTSYRPNSGAVATNGNRIQRKTNQSIAPVQSTTNTSRVAGTSTPTGTLPAVSSDANQNERLRQNLTPEQLEFASQADLVDNIGVVSRMPLPSVEVMSDITKNAESNNSYNVAFADVDNNGSIRNTSNLETAQQWSKRVLGIEKNLTDMSVGEVIQFQKDRPSGQNAVGAYQIIPSTLTSIVKNEKINPSQKFDKELQDKLAATLMLSNGKILRRNGIIPDKVNVYMAHRLGAPVTIKLYNEIKENPDKSVADIATDVYIRRNNLNTRTDGAAISKYKRMIVKNNPDFVTPIGSFYDILSKKIASKSTVADIKENITSNKSKCPNCGGVALDNEILAEKKDACYHKVKSRYKVWPSAYASGALVKCRKRGASNWGKSKTNENLYFNVVGTDKKILINEFNMRRDVRGWYLTGDSASSTKLDAFRAFGIPLTEEELNQAGYSGSAATIEVDNPISPVGSLSKSQRINKKSRSK
jgi:LysM repeat protein